MAQTGYTPILIYSSSTAAAAPAAGSLTNSTLGSELAINITDGKLFYKDNANVVQVIGWKVVPTTAGGTGLTSYAQGDLLYYNSGTTLTALAKSTTATRYLSNTGTNNNPAWAQVDLTNGVTGTLPTTNGGTGLASFTASRVLYTSSTSAIGQSSNLTFDGTNLGVGTSSPGGRVGVVGGGGTTSTINLIGGNSNDNATISSVYNLAFQVDSNNNIGGRTFDWRYGGKGYSDGTHLASLNSSGNFSLSIGNLVIGTSGKGIDFSATPGTGTSELLDDYETGVWTPTFVPQTNSFTSITYDADTGGRYTKIGNCVHIQGQITTDAITVGTATGGIRIGGLPFTVVANSGGTANGWASIAIGAATTWAGERPLQMLARQNEALCNLYYRTTVDGDSLVSVVADLGTGANSNIIYFAGTYITA